MTLSEKEEAILEAARKGEVSAIKELLSENAENIDVQDEYGSTPLHLAVKGGHFLVVQQLLEAKARPSIPDILGLEPIQYALENGQDGIVTRMLDAGATSEQEDIQSPTEKRYALMPNGIPLTKLSTRAEHAPKTDYILIQTEKRFKPDQKTELKDLGVDILEYIPKNTYICNYPHESLERVRQTDSVVSVGVYPLLHKLPHGLIYKRVDMKVYHVDVIFHRDVDGWKHRNCVAKLSGMTPTGIEGIEEIFETKVRLEVEGRYLLNIAQMDAVRNVEEVPITSLCNDRASKLIRADINSQVSSGLHHSYRGNGQVIAINDTGLDRKHKAFDGVIIHYHPGTVDGDQFGHGTHVCASAVGDGTSKSGQRITGTAPEAALLVNCLADWDANGQVKLRIPPTLSELFLWPYGWQPGVNSNSWSSAPLDARVQTHYTRRSMEIDDFVLEYPEVVVCFSAGNDGGNAKIPAQVGAEAAAKNCITVGASNSDRNGADPLGVAQFSSRGPTVNGRVKPDVLAPGTDILSARSSGSPHPSNGPDMDWCFDSGTSMATPLVAGCVASLREALSSPEPMPPIEATLVKALLINGADPLYDQRSSGFGRVNLASSISIVHKSRGGDYCEDEVDDTNSVFSRQLTIDSSHSKLKITLVWTDPPGIGIQNSLLLSVEINDDGTKYNRQGDDDNNVQQIIWTNVPSGKATMTVESLGLLRPPQPFSLVWQLS